MKTRTKLLRLSAVGIVAALILVVATPAYAWTSVGFSGTFVGPHGAVSVSTYPYYRYHRYYRYYPYRTYYRYYPYRSYVYPRVYYRHYYYRPYVRSYYRPYYPVRRVYLRPAYSGSYCYPY